MVSTQSAIGANIDDYIKNRLDDQIGWYEKKSAFNKMRYRLFQIIIIVAGAIIPIVNLLGISSDPAQQHHALVISAVLGSIITIATAFREMEKYYETWILYRTTSESLKQERFFYHNGVGVYTSLAKENKDRSLVERVEMLLSTENSKFFALQQQQQQQQQPSQQPTSTSPEKKS